jgi:membrane protease YdiL (CAAX protease family)
MISPRQQPAATVLMTRTPDRFDVLLNAGSFVLVAVVLWLLVMNLLPPSDIVYRSVTASLVAGIGANLFSARKFDSDIGLRWSRAAGRQAIVGLLLGGGAMAAIVFGAMAAGWASWGPAETGKVTVIAVLLLMGAVGEELLFRGYGFQFLARSWPDATIVTTGLLFGLTHVLLNQNIQWIGAFNTALWGALLGYAFCRANSLWLPIGIHYGWNLFQVLLGASLSGTTIRATGVELHWSAGELWSGGAYGPEGGLLTTAAGVVVLLILRRVR